jgi:transcriptional regulator GlxA family with amidase domain
MAPALHHGSMSERPVVVVVFPGVQPLDALGPIEVFSGATRAARALGRDEGYCVQIASSDGQPVTSESGVGLCTTPLPDPGEPIDTLVIAGGRGSRAARRDERLISWLKTVAPRCRRVTTVCTGTFVGAEAGLLDGRRVTTHWASAEELGDEFPRVRVDADPIYIKDGKYWTSAGVTAGIDLALALVSEDLGVEVAQTVARWLVMFLHRPGGQTQFASPVWVRRAERSTVRAVQALVESAPGGDHRVPTLAAAAAMSVRNFTRVFSAEVGETPGKFVERVRLEAARTELETTDDTLDVIAARCGFGTAESLRRITQRHLGVAPDAYRRRFHTVPHERTHP